ncbi:retrovirus-related Pol polyprotein from transposon 412 [Trichonephila clavipes]|nr:retrovirus-related Pol polyprotein from transposon 412 [Trichonephila clavipes]
MIFLRGRIIGRLECEHTQLDVSEELGIAQSVISRLWQRFQDDGWLVWGETIFGSRTDLHVQSVTLTGHIYRDVILEQHVRLFRGAMGAEFLFMADNARPHRVNIVDECLQSENITHMDWPAYSPDLNPIEHVWDMLGRRIAARQPPPTCLPILGDVKTTTPEGECTIKDTPFEWTSETQEAFDDIKKAIINPPVLALPDPNAELQITADASSRGIGAVLEQKYPNSETFLVGDKIKVFTDHKPLAVFLSNKNPSSKILRWKLALEEFNYDIHYIRGSLNSVAHHLSRCINNLTIALPESKDLIKLQHEDPVLSPIIQKIDQNDVGPQVSNYFINEEGLLCHLSKRPSRSHRVMGIQKRHISSYSAHVNERVERPNQSLANILASISQNTNDRDEQLPHTMLALNSAIHEATYTSPFFLEHGRDIQISYTYEKNSDTPHNKYEYVEKL